MPTPIAFVLKGYPRLSETFIAEEIRALEAAGVDIRIVSLRHPTDPARHPVHAEIRAPVRYLPEYLHREPWRVLRALAAARRRSGWRTARRLWLRDLLRDRSVNRVRRFGQAAVLAAELEPEVGQLHAHFMHTPASVVRYAAALTGLPWSCSAHARDIWTTPEWEKREKLADCRWAVTCTALNATHLRALSPDPGRVMLVYHGLDFARVPAPPRRRSPRDGSDPQDPVRVLSVGRAVEKKGYEDLLEALALLPRHLAWRFVHIGGGARAERLRRRARGLGLEERVQWCGAQARERVFAAYGQADLFVLASRVAADGDRDGLPNVLVEAQSQRLACVATRVSAIPELIEAGVSGELVAPGDPPALAAALAALAADPARRERLAQAGFARVHERFDANTGFERLAARFGANAAR